jgi:hypothetical protein
MAVYQTAWPGRFRLRRRNAICTCGWELDSRESLFRIQAFLQTKRYMHCGLVERVR